MKQERYSEQPTTDSADMFVQQTYRLANDVMTFYRQYAAAAAKKKREAQSQRAFFQFLLGCQKFTSLANTQYTRTAYNKNIK